MRLIHRVLLAASVTASSAAAVDIFDFSDLRVGVDTVGADYEVSAGGSSSDEKWSSAQRYNADWVAGTDLILLGVAYGAGATYDVRNSSLLDQRSMIGHLQAGPYLSLGPVQLELLGLVGAGRSTISSGGSEVDTSRVEEYGVNLGLTASLVHLVAGVRGGWLQQSGDFTSGSGQNFQVKSSDFTGGVFVGWRF